MSRPASPPTPITFRGHGNSSWLLVLLVLVLTWLGLLGYTLWRMREDALQSTLHMAELHARDFEEHLTQTLQLIELTATGTDPHLLQSLPHRQVNDLLERVVRPAAMLRSLSLLDAQGRIVASSSPDNIGTQVNTDTFFPDVHAQADVLRIGTIWQGRDFHDGLPIPPPADTPTGTTFLPVLRTLPGATKPQWLLAAVNPDYFTAHGIQMLDPDQGHARWLRYDQRLLMSSLPSDHPGSQEADGELARRLELREFDRFEQTLANLGEVLTAYRASSRYPMVVTVHLLREQALQDWAEESRHLLAISGSALVGLLLAAGVAWRRRLALQRQQALQDNEQRLAASVFAHSHDAIAICDHTGQIVAVNAAFERLTDCTAADVTGRTLPPPAALQPGQPLQTAVHQALQQQHFWQGEVPIHDRQGQPRFVQLTVHAVHGRQGELQHYTCILADITERKASEERLKLSASVFSHAREGIVITDPNANILEVNEAFSHITGYSRQEILGKTPKVLSSGRQDAAFYATMWQHLTTQGSWSGEIWNRRKSGEVYAELLTISAVRDESGRTLHYVALFSDISQQKESELRLKHIAHFDTLTNLPNRALLSDRLRQAMNDAQRRSEKLAVVFMDLDGFKAINDTHGHEMGDHLLITLATRMKQALRDSDTIARLGGDEFVMVLPNTNDPKVCVPVLERLKAAAAHPVSVEGTTLQVSASMGVVFYPQAEDIEAEDIDAEQLLRQADQAMYQAKQAGRNRYHFFDAEHDRDVRGRHESQAQIRDALHNDEFVLYYQPKVNMRTGQVLGMEALIRWEHPERGLLPPALFLPMLEDSPLSLDLGRWVMASAVKQVEHWKRAGLRLTVSINVDGYQLQQPDFEEHLRDLLALHPGVAPGDLQLEILETNALDDMGRVTQVIEACQHFGVSFALDDFGTGYSSLSYLRHLPAQTLKIDQSFVRDMLDDPDDLAILDVVIGLSTAFGRDVIAEGVETVEHGQMLLRLGCDWGQGYAIAKPMPAHEVAAWMQHWRPDTSWYSVPRVQREDLPLLFAMVEHRAWMAGLEAHLHDENHPVPSLDPQECRFGHWLEHKGGRSQYGNHPAFARLDAEHQAIHAQAERLLTLPRDEALAQLPALHATREAFLRTLMDIQQ